MADPDTDDALHAQSGPSDRRLAVHAAVLTLVLLALAALVGVDRGVFDADEGGYLLQLDLLERTGERFGDYWAADIDPSFDFVPVEHAVASGDGIAPMLRRPTLTLVLGAAYAIGGLAAATALGCVAAGAASGIVGLITRELRPHLALAALWTAGLATPLAFDALVLRGHAIGAALSGVAVLAAVRIVRGAPTWGRVALVVAALTAAGMLRKECLFLAVALGVGMAVVAVRDRRAELLPAAALAAGASAAALAADLAVSWAWVGDADVRSLPSAGGSTSSIVESRLDSLWTATFRPAYEVAGYRAGAITLFLAVVLGTLVIVSHRRRPDPTLLLAGLSLSALLVVARVTVLRNEPDLVPGLFAASPVVLWGVVSLRRDQLREPATTVLGVAAACFWAAVVATQYSIGGAWEWGARYLEAGLPLVVPLAVLGLAAVVEELDRHRARRVVAVIAGTCVVLTASGVVAQREARLRVEHQIDVSLELAAGTQSEVVVSTFPSLPRSATAMFREEQRWLWTWPDGLPALVDALEGGDMEDAVLVTHDAERSDELLQSTGWRHDGWAPLPANPGTWHITTIRADDTRP